MLIPGLLLYSKDGTRVPILLIRKDEHDWKVVAIRKEGIIPFSIWESAIRKNWVVKGL